MRRRQIKKLASFCPEPSINGATARKRQRMCFASLDNGDLNVAVEWRCGYGLPLPPSHIIRSGETADLI
jgi:hypothetical protein